MLNTEVLQGAPTGRCERMGAGRIEADRADCERVDDGATRMRAEQISGRGAGYASAHGERPSAKYPIVGRLGRRHFFFLNGRISFAVNCKVTLDRYAR